MTDHVPAIPCAELHQSSADTLAQVPLCQDFLACQQLTAPLFARRSISGRSPSGLRPRTSPWYSTRAPPTSGCRPSTAPAKPAVSRGSSTGRLPPASCSGIPGDTPGVVPERLWGHQHTQPRGPGGTGDFPTQLSPPSRYTRVTEIREGQAEGEPQRVCLLRRRRRSHHQHPAPSARGRYRTCSLGHSYGRAFKQTSKDDSA